MAIEYIDLTKVSNEATVEVVNGAVRVTPDGSVTTISGGITVINTPLPVSGSVGITTSPVPTSENWRVALIQDEALNSSNKLFTVPSNQEWQILWIWAEFTTSTGIGTRQMSIQVLDNEMDIISRYQAGVTQATTLIRNYLIAPTVPDMLAFRDTDCLTTPIPPTMVLASGQKLRVWDNKAFDPFHDTINAQLQYAWRLVP